MHEHLSSQVVVLIKCISQWDVIWWHAETIAPNNPLAPARIIGIEQRVYYAVYDLAVLLVIFFHRFVQKQMGIWRSVRDDINLEGVYEAQSVPPGKDLG